MELDFYQVDAFSTQPFKGNPAGVVLLSSWPADEVLQAIAAENNLPETAFLLPHQDGYQIRWFAPSSEVPLCGHATLASAFVVFHHLPNPPEEIVFYTQTKGILTVHREADWIVMDFPVLSAEPIALSNQTWLDQFPLVKAYEADKLLLVFPSEAAVRDFKPDLATVQQMHPLAIGITARAEQGDYDIVSRCFAPNLGIDEDPVTGSLHCALIDLWQQEMGKTSLKAWQASARGGAMKLQRIGDRVLIKGKATLFLMGKLFLP